jgi:predicted secreted acid phosphatase
LDHRSEIFNETSFNDWVKLADAPALPASLNLYRKLQELGFTIFLLTGRSEHQRNATEANLLFAGYRNWERLILRYIKIVGS